MQILNSNFCFFLFLVCFLYGLGSLKVTNSSEFSAMSSYHAKSYPDKKPNFNLTFVSPKVTRSPPLMELHIITFDLYRLSLVEINIALTTLLSYMFHSVKHNKNYR